jgi:hypothetical protein
MKFIVSILIITLLSFTMSNQWELQKEKNGMKVYTRMTQYKLKEFKINTTLNTSLERLKAELMDVKNMYQWYDMIEQVDILKQISESEAIYKIHFDFPAITSDRYSVVHATITSDDKSIKVRTKFIEYPHSPEKSKVKISNIYSEWNVKKNGQKLDVEHIGFLDPAGSIPQWLINQNVIDSPMKTLTNLKKRVE